MKERGLAFRLALRLWLAGLLIFGLSAAAIIVQTGAHGDAALRQELTTRADALQTLVRTAGHGRAEMEFDDEITRDYGGRHPAAFFQLLDGAGDVIEQSDFAETARVPAWGAPSAQGQWRTVVIDNRIFLCLLRPLPRSEANRGENEHGQNAADNIGNHEPGNERYRQSDAELRAENVWLAVGVDRTNADHRFRETVWLTLAATATGLLLLCLLAWLLVRHALRPLTQLRDALARSDEHNLAPVAITAPAEIGSVISTLNRLIGQLAAAFARERAFTADAAHELRTPIAELRLVAEVALRRPALAEAECRDYTAVLATAQRMQELVEKLLLLARAEAGALALEPVTLPLLPLVVELLTAHRPAADRRRLTLHAGMLPDATVKTDPALLRIIIDNLVGNAVAYATEGSTVSIRAAADAAGSTITVTNAAAGLAAPDCEIMFDRFWRRDAARTAGTGHGLGLSLARELAVLLGGTLTADTSMSGTIRLTLTLPLAATNPQP